MRVIKTEEAGQLELFAISALTTKADVRTKALRELMGANLFNIGNIHRCSIDHKFGDKFSGVSSEGAGGGVASMHDQDILIFIISHLVHALNRGEDLSARIFFTAHEFFIFTNRRHIGGTRYINIWESLKRLNGTIVHTNIDLANGGTLDHRFNWLTDITRHRSQSGKALGFSVKLADIIFKAINRADPSVLSLDKRYFDFRSGNDKFLYLYARRSAGKEKEWAATEYTIHQRSGTSVILSQYRRLLDRVINQGELADYRVRRAFIGSERALVFQRKWETPKVRKQTVMLLGDD
jgi:plasmid replication initiation protein